MIWGFLQNPPEKEQSRKTTSADGFQLSKRTVSWKPNQTRGGGCTLALHEEVGGTGGESSEEVDEEWERIWGWGKERQKEGL